MPTTPRDIVIMLISLAASFHHGHCWKSFPSWRRSALNRFAASSSSDDNKGSSSLVPPTNGVKQKRPSKYYNENSKNLGKQALKSSSRTKLNTINAYDVNSSLESDSEYPSIMDSNREKRKMDMRSLHNGQYHSLTHELAASRTAFSRAIPPSTLEYDYNQDLDSIDPRDSLPQSPTQHTSNNNNNDPTLHIPLKPRSNAFMQKSTSQSNVVSGTLSKTNSNESIHDTNTTDIPFRNNNIYRKFDSTITRVVNDPVIDSSRRSAMKSSTGISDLPNRFREDQEQSSTTNKYQETLPESSSYPEISNESNRFNFLDVSSTTTMKEDPESYINSLKNRLRTLELDMFALNHDKVFNLNSRREISTLLFGVDNESINKDSLDALAGSNRVPANRIAGLLLSHRKLSRQLKVLEKDMEVTASGIQSGRLSPDTLDSIPLSSSPVGSSKMFVDKAFHSMATTTPSFFDDSDPLMLVDASAYIFRAYYSMPPIHRSDGMPVGAVLGFCNMVNNLILDAYIQGERPRLALVFDSKEGVSVRKTLYPQYKATRPPCPVDLIPQFDLIKQAADAYGIIKIEAPGHEADDVIATLATMARRDGCKVNIYSADKDLMQLITKDGRITMVDPMKLTIISYDAVIEKWGCPPEKLGEVLALAGDSSDNIPGVPGIGPKTAASLINEFGSLDALLSNMDSIKQKARREKLIENVDSITISRKLVKLETDIPAQNMTLPDDFTLHNLRMEARSQANEERLLQFYSDMGLKDIARRVQGRLYKNFHPPPSSSSLSNNLLKISSPEEKIVNMDPTTHFHSDLESSSISTSEIINTSLSPLTFTSPRPKPPPAMEYDDVPF